MNQFIAVYNANGDVISNIKYYDGFMGQRIGAISCLAFHPFWVKPLVLRIRISFTLSCIRLQLESGRSCDHQRAACSHLLTVLMGGCRDQSGASSLVYWL